MMRSRIRAGRLLLPLSLIMAMALAGGGTSAWAARPHILPEAEVLVEGGVGFPYGDLGDDYWNTIKGAGAETGYEVGLRFRYFATPEIAIAPAFHYVDYGDFIGSDEVGTARIVSTATLCYTVDMQIFLTTRDAMTRPFLSAGAGLYRNRFHDEQEGDASYFEESFNALGFSFGGGLRIDQFEFGVYYNVNRFDTVRLWSDAQSYDWDFLSARVGFAFPTY
jgi:hypothetical protein